jgi:hypothetical protein
VGKRQRHSEFVRTSPERLEQITRDKDEPAERRMKAVAELKFRKLRNRQKRSK